MNLKDAKDRKNTPVFSGVLKYFPDAIREVARCSKVGNDQHNPNKPLFWDRSKSGDELDALSRHLLEAGTIDTDGIRHSAKVAWRALANLQKEIEKEKKSYDALDEMYEEEWTEDRKNKVLYGDLGLPHTHDDWIDAWTEQCKKNVELNNNK